MLLILPWIQSLHQTRGDSKVRREMTKEPAAKEKRQRQARARHSTTTPARVRTSQPETPSLDEGAAQSPARPLH